MGIDYYASNNKKFYISIKTTLDAVGYVSLFNENGEILLKDIKSSYEIGGTRGAVSNDGKLFATAAYSYKGIDLRNINGDLIWNNKEIKRFRDWHFLLIINICTFGMVMNQNIHIMLEYLME